MTKHAMGRRKVPTRAIVPGVVRARRMLLLSADDHWRRPGPCRVYAADGVTLLRTLDPLTRRPI